MARPLSKLTFSGAAPGHSSEDGRGRATQVRLFDFRSRPMKAFHLSWFAFFVSFVAWFGIAPLMALVRDDLRLSKDQIANTVIASVAITVFARIIFGWLCDRFGPRRTYTALLSMGAIPVMCIGLAHSYQSFLLFRLAIGCVGASFVITQHQTSVMFSPEVVGAANATSAGWGNLGGGVAQWLMPLLAGAIAGLGADHFLIWRLAMVVPGLAMLVAAVLYFRFASDTPDGAAWSAGSSGRNFWRAAGDSRVWLLFALYGACFGVEITLDNVAALYFKDFLHVGLTMAGVLASATGMMNIFARTCGGLVGDWAGSKGGLRARSVALGALLLLEGVALATFSSQTRLGLAVATYLLFGLLVCMACGATYAIVPLLRNDAIGSVSGIVGAGGNAGAIFAGFLLKAQSISEPRALFILGIIVSFAALGVLALRPQESEAPELVGRRSAEAMLGAEPGD